MKIAITGANSSVGMNLLAQVDQQPDLHFIAGVRSESARQALPDSPQIASVCIRYDDVDALAESLDGANCVVHLAGILIEGKQSKYREANVDATRSVIDAAKRIGAKHLVFISVVGADSKSSNAYFRSKGEAEDIVAASGLSATVIRTPILLGPGTAGASALVNAARNPKAKALGGGHYKMRPLDIDDLNTAIFNACKSQAPGFANYELVGPEAIAYCDLITKTARKINPDSTLTVGSIPIGFTKLMAAITSTLKGGGFTPTVIEVITQDEEVSHNGFAELGVTLTSLDRTIEKILEQ
jgi:NADH dehydrogenase